MPNLIGQILLAQFRVDAFVASGGMGAVYRVWDLKRNVSLAMKVLHSELAADPAMFERFQREANALKKLAHPNIVPFYGLYQTSDFVFLLERFIDGPSLKDVLKQYQGNPITGNEALTFLKPLCAALGYAHVNGVVHCDVKPGNVMIDRGGSVYLTDFGIARRLESNTTMGKTGTPAYMAPEQIRGEAVSPATDIYSLGVVLYEMLTGQRPFRGIEAGTEKGGTTTNERIRYGHLNLQPPDPRTFNPNLSDGLANAMLMALAKQPQNRYISTLDFFNAVCLQVGGTVGDMPDRVVLPVGKDTLKRPVGIPDNQSVARYVQSSKHNSTWLVVGGVVVCMLAIIAFVSLYPGSVIGQSTYNLPTRPAFPKAASTAGPISNNMNVIASRTTDSELDSLLTILNANGIVPSEQLKPGSKSYTVSVQTTDRDLWNWGWCTSSPIFLQKYLNAIQIEFLIDGVPLPEAQIRQNQGPFQDKASGKILYCYQWSSTLSQWRAGTEVQLDIQARFLNDINDGENIFPKGDYFQHITVSVTNHP